MSERALGICRNSQVLHSEGSDCREFHVVETPAPSQTEACTTAMKYWQCPRDESHTLEFFPRWQAQRMRCKVCEIPAVLDYSPARKPQAAQPVACDPRGGEPMTPEHKAELFLQKLAKQGKLRLMSHGSYAWTWQECRETLAAYDVDLLAHIHALEEALQKYGSHAAGCISHVSGMPHMHRGVDCDERHACDCGWSDAALSPAPATKGRP